MPPRSGCSRSACALNQSAALQNAGLVRRTPKRAVKRYLRELRPAQEALGALNDEAVARALLEARASEGREVWFGLGWLTARREATAAACEAGLRQLAKASRPWAIRRSARPRPGR